MSNYNDDSKGNYTVGRGKPPLHSQFKKGKSGNPSGKPKQQKPFCQTVFEEFHKPMTVVVKGKKMKMSAADLTAKQLVKASAETKLHAIKLVLSLVTAEQDRRVAAERLDDPGFVNAFVWTEEDEARYQKVIKGVEELGLSDDDKPTVKSPNKPDKDPH